MATGAGVGSTTITATVSGISGNTTLTVTAAELASIQVTPATPSIAKGVTQQFVATGTYTDATTQILTSTASWTSSSTSIATIETAGDSNPGLATGAGVGSATITATVSGISGNTTLTVTAATLVSIDVTPATPSIAKGVTQQFVATGTYTDASTQTLTSVASWTSSSTSVATIETSGDSNPGLATGAGVGSSTITATVSGISNTATLTVTAATLVSIDVTPATPSIAKGVTQQFVATGTYTDASTQTLTTVASWTSSATSIATVETSGDTTPGLSTGVAIGSATITATVSGISGDTTLTVTAAELVSIAVTPVTQIVNIGNTLQMTATGTYTDASNQDITNTVSWASSVTSYVTIQTSGDTNPGLATAVASGTSTITATLGAISGDTSIQVSLFSMCGTGVNDTDSTNATGECLKVATNSSGSWFTSTPSLALINLLGYTQSTGDSGGKTYALPTTSRTFLALLEYL